MFREIQTECETPPTERQLEPGADRNPSRGTILSNTKARPSNTQETPQWVTIRDAAEHYQCSTKTIRRWITQGLIDAQRVGPRLIRVSTASLDALGRTLVYSA